MPAAGAGRALWSLRGGGSGAVGKQTHTVVLALSLKVKVDMALSTTVHRTVNEPLSLSRGVKDSCITFASLGRPALKKRTP